MNFIQRLITECKYIRLRSWTYKDVGGFWDTITDYDKINKKRPAYIRRFTEGFNLSDIPDQSYILDICSRSGNGTAYFYKNGKIRRAICADVSENMQKLCEQNLKKHAINFRTVLFTELPLPFQDNEFDAVLSFETIEHMPDPETFLKELARVIKSNGELVLTTPNILWEPFHWFIAVFNLHHSEGPHRFLSRRRLLKAIHKAGFKIDREKTTVLVSCGPNILNRFDKILERLLPEYLLRVFALRRVLICRRIG